MRESNEIGRRVRAAVFAGIAGLAVAAAPASAQVTAVNGRIAYTICDYDSSLGFVVCDIWSVEPDGTGATNLTNTPEVSEFDPTWSPDGTRIAFVEGGNFFNRIMVMNGDGSGVAAVTPTADYQFSPTWSADGTRLAFVRQTTGQVITIQFDIFSIGVDGSGETNLTQTDGDEFDPAWSPDGARIAFAAVRPEMSADPITGEPIELAQYEIVTVDPDGSGEAVISSGTPGTERGDRLEEDRGPQWSPDGSKLVFMSQSVDPCCPPWQIWAVNRDGSGASLLSDDPNVYDVGPSFSPDGTQIVFSSSRDPNGGGSFDLYTIPAPATLPLAAPTVAARSAVPAAAATAAVTRLTTDGRVADPSWGREPETGPPPLDPLLHVSLAFGPGAGGSVASIPSGIRCGTDCEERYAIGSHVFLFAIPRRGSAFAGWTGACTWRFPVCPVRMDQAKAATAHFLRRR